MAYLKAKGLYRGKLVIVFSDYHLHRFWLYNEADLYICNIPDQVTELKKLGIDGMKRQKGAFTNITLPSRTEYNPGLDNALGPALSTLEKDARQTAFWIHAVFKMYEQDRGIGADAESGKAAFMHTIYLQGGVLKN